MIVFRWILGVLATLTAAGALASFIVYIAFQVPICLERARRLRHWTWLAFLLWFNTEVWGSVVRTLYHWSR